ncbi:MAG: (Fe-S)-binding protein [Gemmatimonadetes bacterium]|jgi:Fe-S oxidoreductase|nr:(Fe-S)-binding protein [Gemmatimonadota bacterium]
MSTIATPIKLSEIENTPLRDLLGQDTCWQADLNYCMSCGKCLSVCPLHGYSEWDPRRVVKMVMLGLEEEVINADFIYQCTTCERCSYVCPMGVKIGNMITRARSLRDRDQVPGGSQKTADLHRSTGNNMQISTEDWLDTVDWMKEEVQDDYPDLDFPIDLKGADYFVTINSKLPQYYPMDLQCIYKVFHAAGVSWTMPSTWWEGTNYAMFSGDLDTWEYTLRQQVKRVEELGIKRIAYTECGHGYYATLAGYERFGIEPNFEVVHKANLYAQWLREGRIEVDPSRNPQRVTLHDPCNAGRKAIMGGYPDILDDSRYVLERVCENFVEMWPNREYNYCCSGGGGALISGFKKARNYYGKMKVDQIDRTGADLVCTPCVNCHDAIEDIGKEYERPWKPIHLWGLLANALVLD